MCMETRYLKREVDKWGENDRKDGRTDRQTAGTPLNTITEWIDSRRQAAGKYCMYVCEDNQNDRKIDRYNNNMRSSRGIRSTP